MKHYVQQPWEIWHDLLSEGDQLSAQISLQNTNMVVGGGWVTTLTRGAERRFHGIVCQVS